MPHSIRPCVVTPHQPLSNEQSRTFTAKPATSSIVKSQETGSKGLFQTIWNFILRWVCCYRKEVIEVSEPDSIAPDLETEETGPESLPNKLKEATLEAIEKFWSGKMSEKVCLQPFGDSSYLFWSKLGNELALLIQIPTSLSSNDLLYFLAEAIDVKGERSGFVMQKVHTNLNWNELPEKVTDELFYNYTPQTDKKFHWGILEATNFNEQPAEDKENLRQAAKASKQDVLDLFSEL